MVNKLKKEEVFQEEISSWSLYLLEHILETVELTEDDEDKILDLIDRALDEFFESPPYRNYN